MSSTGTAFEVDLLIEYEAHMHRNQGSYRGLAEVCNDLSSRFFKDCIPDLLDRRALTDAHLRLVVLFGQQRFSAHVIEVLYYLGIEVSVVDVV